MEKQRNQNLKSVWALVRLCGERIKNVFAACTHSGRGGGALGARKLPCARVRIPLGVGSFWRLGCAGFRVCKAAKWSAGSLASNLRGSCIRKREAVASGNEKQLQKEAWGSCVRKREALALGNLKLLYFRRAQQCYPT